MRPLNGYAWEWAMCRVCLGESDTEICMECYEKTMAGIVTRAPALCHGEGVANGG